MALGQLLLLSSLWTIQSLRQVMCWGAGLLFRGTVAGWGNGLTGTTQGPTTADTKSCPRTSKSQA